MAVGFNNISNYKSRKFIVENISGGVLTIGDLKITLKKDDSIDLLAQNSFTKKPVREFEEIAASRDLELLIVLGKVRIYDENGALTTDNAINLSDFADEAGVGSSSGSSGSGVQVVTVSDISNPTELASEAGSSTGELVLAAQTSPFKYTLYVYTTSTVSEDSPHVVSGSSGTWLALSGEYMKQVNMGNYLLEKAQIACFSEKIVALGTISGSNNVNLNQGNVFTCTIDGATTLNFVATSGLSGQSESFILYITNGGENVTWGSTIVWPLGSPPVLTASGVDRITFQTLDNGTTWYGVTSGTNFS